MRRHVGRSHQTPIELGFPAELAKYCFGLPKHIRSNREDLALAKLIRQTIKNVRHLERIPESKLRRYAWGMTEFPMMVSLRTTTKMIRDRLGRAGIELSGDRGPGHRFNAHWVNDDFSAIAEQFVFRLFGGPPGKIDFALWKKTLRPAMRLAFKDYLRENPKVEQRLAAIIKQKERRTPGVLRERVINRLLDKTKNFWGFRAKR